MSVRSPELDLQPEKLSDRELLEALYNASDWYDLIKTGFFRRALANAKTGEMAKDLYEELSGLFGDLGQGAFNVSCYPSDMSYEDNNSVVTDVPYMVSLGEPVTVLLGEVLDIRENRSGRLAVEIAHPFAGVARDQGQPKLRGYVVPFEAVTNITEVGYFEGLAQMGEHS